MVTAVVRMDVAAQALKRAQALMVKAVAQGRAAQDLAATKARALERRTVNLETVLRLPSRTGSKLRLPRLSPSEVRL